MNAGKDRGNQYVRNNKTVTWKGGCTADRLNTWSQQCHRVGNTSQFFQTMAGGGGKPFNFISTALANSGLACCAPKRLCIGEIVMGR